MEEIKKKAGRPVVPADQRKKNRAVSLTDGEYQALEKQAAERGIGVSAYIIKRLKLS